MRVHFYFETSGDLARIQHEMGVIMLNKSVICLLDSNFIYFSGASGIGQLSSPYPMRDGDSIDTQWR